ncbi:short/branched chain specific acyl-CoA dehydrogenase, mitochondrial-like [Dysidea avara]|uniref:short/branched chain specific acyl-CoA dehydrogenase, mitochondrial-like n=1 Tax=Dysidea avara TaxID=196820 RepID=UPI003318DD61
MQLLRGLRLVGSSLLLRTGKCTRNLATISMCKRMSTQLTQLSDEENMMKQTVAKFAQEKVAPLVKEMDENCRIDQSIVDAVFEQGFMGVEVPQELGGVGGNFFSVILLVEELAKVDMSVSGFCDLQMVAVHMLKTYAGQALQQKYLPMLAKNMVGCVCLSEPSCGSDAFALQTKADKQGEHYVINGEKAWITNAGRGGVFLVMANVDFSKGHKGITAFAVDRDTPGLSVLKRTNQMGLHAVSTHPVMFDNVKVHESQVVGEVGKGYKYAIETLNIGRIGIAAQMLGLAEGALAHTMPYLKERKAFGQPIGQFQAMQHQYANLATQIEAVRMLTYNAARLKENGQPCIKEAAMAKYYAAEVAANTASRCIELVGGVGFTREFPLEKYYRDVKAGQIYEGTANIQLNTIANLIWNEL